jgi:hypothetical protein
MATLWREIPVSSTQMNGKQVAVGVWVCDLCCALSLPLGPPHAPVHVHETIGRGALARDEHIYTFARKHVNSLLLFEKSKAQIPLEPRETVFSATLYYLMASRFFRRLLTLLCNSLTHSLRVSFTNTGI